LDLALVDLVAKDTALLFAELDETGTWDGIIDVEPRCIADTRAARSGGGGRASGLMDQHLGLQWGVVRSVELSVDRVELAHHFRRLAHRCRVAEPVKVQQGVRPSLDADALEPRPYRPAMAPADAAEYLRDEPARTTVAAVSTEMSLRPPGSTRTPR
jgi:hypothetical protein